MARKPRLHVEGAFYHVILRGNGGGKIFFANSDRSRLFSLIREGTERFGYRLHAFCFMSNHIHLLIQVGSVSLSKVVQNFSFRYTKYINKRKNRFGHLFQGRYKAILIDADSYLLELVRYIHNNPVRAGIAARALDYKWSSHRAYLGLEKLPFLTTDWTLGQFAGTVQSAREKFAEFVERGNEEGHRSDFYNGEHDSRVLGEDRFVENVLTQKIVFRKPDLSSIITYVCEKYGVTEEQLRSPSRQRKRSEARGNVGWLVTNLEAASLSLVSKQFNRDLGTMSRAVRNIEERMLESEEFKKQLEKDLKALAYNATTQA